MLSPLDKVNLINYNEVKQINFEIGDCVMNKSNALIKGAEAVSLFCRLNINSKKDIPIRSSEMGLLILAVKNEQPVTPIMAADFFKVKKPMITAMLNKLVSAGFIEKIPSKEDKRSFVLSPTDKALILVEQAYDEYFKTMGLLQRGLGEKEYSTLVELLEKANKILLEDKENG